MGCRARRANISSPLSLLQHATHSLYFMRSPPGYDVTAAGGLTHGCGGGCVVVIEGVCSSPPTPLPSAAPHLYSDLRFGRPVVLRSTSIRYGRRQVIAVGLAATALLAPFFGLAQSLWQAMLVRFVMGLLNGNQGVAKAYIGDAVTPQTESLGYSLVAICWGCGNVVGASAGGLFARPALSMPALFGGSIFATYPYLLPCMASSLFALLGLILTQLFLPDIGPTKRSSAARPPSTGPYAYIRQHRRCWYVLCLFFCISFLDYGMFEVYPLWAISAVATGGLDWGTAQVGLTQMLSGGFLLVGNLVIMPWLQRRQSPRALQRFGIVAMCAPGFSLFPLAALCCAATVWAYAAVLPVLFLRITGPGVVFTLTFAFINNMVHDPRLRGGVTGVGQQVGCLARCISPTLSAKLFAWGNRSSLPFPLDRHLTFVVFGLAWLLPLWLNTCLTDADVMQRNRDALATEEPENTDNEEQRCLLPKA